MELDIFCKTSAKKLNKIIHSNSESSSIFECRKKSLSVHQSNCIILFTIDLKSDSFYLRKNSLPILEYKKENHQLN